MIYRLPENNIIHRLSDCKENAKFTIAKIDLPAKQSAKLDKLGVFEGETIKIEKKLGKSALILNASGAIIAVGREIADKISVTEAL